MVDAGLPGRARPSRRPQRGARAAGVTTARRARLRAALGRRRLAADGRHDDRRRLARARAGDRPARPARCATRPSTPRARRLAGRVAAAAAPRADRLEAAAPRKVAGTIERFAATPAGRAGDITPGAVDPGWPDRSESGPRIVPPRPEDGSISAAARRRDRRCSRSSRRTSISAAGAAPDRACPPDPAAHGAPRPDPPPARRRSRQPRTHPDGPSARLLQAAVQPSASLERRASRRSAAARPILAPSGTRDSSSAQKRGEWSMTSRWATSCSTT